MNEMGHGVWNEWLERREWEDLERHSGRERVGTCKGRAVVEIWHWTVIAVELLSLQTLLTHTSMENGH